MARKHPSDWYTRTLIAKHGPTDRTLYDVLNAVETFGRDDGRVIYASQPEIAARARIHNVRTVKAALRRLEADGWLIVVRPLVYVKGAATGYLVEREPMVAAACEAVGVPVDNDDGRGALGPPLTESLGGLESPPNPNLGGLESTFRGALGPPLGQGDIREGGRVRVREAARQAPPAVAGATAPPLPELDDNGKPQPPVRPVQTCPEHDGWKGDHICRKCMTDRLASENYDDAVSDYRAALDAWESSRCRHGIPDGVNGGCVDCLSAQLAADRDAAERAAVAEREAARVAALPECGHNVAGGDTPADEHGRTSGACLVCEAARRKAHTRTGCPDDECHPLAVRAYLSGRYRRTATIGRTG